MHGTRRCGLRSSLRDFVFLVFSVSARGCAGEEARSVRIGMERAGGAVAAGGTVAFSWEHQPGVSKQSRPAEAEKTTRPAASANSKKVTGGSAQPHCLRVPPPPGGPGAPAVSPPARSRGVRPEEDPFLAAYLACTASGRKGARGRKGAQKLLGWTGLGLGLGLSCKSSCGVVEGRAVRLAKIPQVDDDH